MMEYLRPRFIDELNETGNIAVLDYEWTPYDILEGMIKDGGSAPAFKEWLNRFKSDCVEWCNEFLTETECLDRFKDLCHRIKRKSVLPFVGAGMSIPCGFKSWGPFLLSLLADAPQLRSEIEALLQHGRYEEAASQIETTLGTEAFAEEIESKLGPHHLNVDGPVNLLPEIFDSGCITTNFDYVLPKVYGNADKPFKETYAGVRLQDAARVVGLEPHCLMCLHGVANERTARVLTAKEYEDAYAKSGFDQVLERLVGSRSLLFMGCSLGADRTYDALKKIKNRSHGAQIEHYAFLPLPPPSERTTRRQFLVQAEIHPIYYPADDHEGSIEALLISMIEGARDV